MHAAKIFPEISRPKLSALMKQDWENFSKSWEEQIRKKTSIEEKILSWYRVARLYWRIKDQTLIRTINEIHKYVNIDPTLKKTGGLINRTELKELLLLCEERCIEKRGTLNKEYFKSQISKWRNKPHLSQQRAKIAIFYLYISLGRAVSSPQFSVKNICCDNEDILIQPWQSLAGLFKQPLHNNSESDILSRFLRGVITPTAFKKMDNPDPHERGDYYSSKSGFFEDQKLTSVSEYERNLLAMMVLLKTRGLVDSFLSAKIKKMDLDTWAKQEMSSIKLQASNMEFWLKMK
jgi:hypothetical protein